MADRLRDLAASLLAWGRGWKTLTDIGDDDGVVAAVELLLLRELKENHDMERVTVVEDEEDEETSEAELNS